MHEAHRALQVNAVLKRHVVGFREAFKLFNPTGHGSISHAQFVSRWHELGFAVESDDVRKVLSEWDDGADY